MKYRMTTNQPHEIHQFEMWCGQIYFSGIFVQQGQQCMTNIEFKYWNGIYLSLLDVFITRIRCSWGELTHATDIGSPRAICFVLRKNIAATPSEQLQSKYCVKCLLFEASRQSCTWIIDRKYKILVIWTPWMNSQELIVKRSWSTEANCNFRICRRKNSLRNLFKQEMTGSYTTSWTTTAFHVIPAVDSLYVTIIIICFTVGTVGNTLALRYLFFFDQAIYFKLNIDQSYVKFLALYISL